MHQDGIYYILANHAGEFSYLALDVPSSNNNDGVVIQQFGYNGNPNQQWRLRNVANGLLTIVNVQTGKALDVPNGLPTPGLPIQQYRLHGGLNQQWRFQSFPAVSGPTLFRPEYHRIFNGASGLAIDVPNGSLEWRVKIQQYTPNNGWNQTWLLRRK